MSESTFTLAQLKEEMLKWEDFYGGDIPDYKRILEAKTKIELQKILNEHRVFMEDMLTDALSHLDHFKQKLGLDIIED